MEQLTAIHAVFIGWVKARRPLFDADESATCEFWIASAAPSGVIDSLGLSSEFLRAKMDTGNVILVGVDSKQSLAAQLGFDASFVSARSLMTDLCQDARTRRLS